MKAIILAAGMGTRLGSYTKELPKCMLSFNGKTLIERQAETLRSCGINDITIVKGYMPEKIRIPGVKYYVNDEFADTNMVETLFKAEKEMNEDLLVCYSDIIYEKRVLDKILESKADIGVTVDEDYWDYWKARLDHPEQDTESLVIENDKIVELGDTKCGPEKAKVRYVGIIKFSKKGLESLKKVYHDNRKKYHDKDCPWLRSKSFKKAYMTCMLQALINAGYKIDPVIITRGWLEFDTTMDYEKYNQWLRESILNRFFNLKADKVGKVIWFTGLSGSGKTTISLELKRRLELIGKKVEILDGDIIRNTLNLHLGFSRDDIRENNKLIAEFACEKMKELDFVLVAVIAPYKEDRANTRSIIGEHLIEVFIDSSLKKCIQRDVKGLYKKALSGEINNFVGISDSNPYEIPKNPDFKLDTEFLDVDESLNQMMVFLKNKNLYNPPHQKI